MVLSLLSAPVLEEAPNYGSSQTQGLLVNGTTGDSGLGEECIYNLLRVGEEDNGLGGNPSHPVSLL
jgi:hypothetical protein